MPRSLCRNAGRLLNCAAFRSSNLGNVSNDPPTAMSASTQKRRVGSRLLMVTCVLLAAAMPVPHASLHNARDRKSYKAQFGRPGRTADWVFNEKVGSRRLFVPNWPFAVARVLPHVATQSP